MLLSTPFDKNSQKPTAAYVMLETESCFFVQRKKHKVVKLVKVTSRIPSFHHSHNDRHHKVPSTVCCRSTQNVLTSQTPKMLVFFVILLLIHLIASLARSRGRSSEPSDDGFVVIRHELYVGLVGCRHFAMDRKRYIYIYITAVS